MNILILFEMKFKQDMKILTGILDYYGFKKVTETLYITDLSAIELEEFKGKVKEKNIKKGSILIIPLCKGCYNKIETIGKEILNENKEYMIL
ncbi:CRISPR-associated endonuclease Cas2 [Methanobrevibacter woesei]|uniref:CRISPR-associated endonuclease Cas2 n=1 Tax=Methanobrevibacter woesei TaxID=190976 RepID=UPI00320B82AE